MLVNIKDKRTVKSLIVNANRNEFYYVLNRDNGKFITGREFAKQTWAKGLNSKGKPILIGNTDPSEQGTVVFPEFLGTTNYSSPTYNPQTQFLYVFTKQTR